MIDPRDELLTTAEVLEILGVSRDTFDKWRAARKAPPAYRLPNGKLRFRRTDVETWLQELPDRMN